MAVASGCSDRKSRNCAVTGNPTNQVSYVELKDQDVLVSVDGHKLTKADVERQVALDVALLKYKGVLLSGGLNAQMKGKLARRVRDQFIARTLLLGDAERKQVQEDAETLAQARLEIAEAYGLDETTNRFDAILVGMKADSRALLEKNIRIAARLYAYINRMAGDKVRIDEKEIDEVVKHGNEKKEQSIRVLAEQREKALKLYGRLQKGEDFQTVAASSDTADEDNGIGEWGEFSLGEVEQLVPKLGPAVSRLAVGDYTPPVECDDAIYIVRLAKKDGSGYASAVNLAPERRTLERIVVKLPVLYEVAPRELIHATLVREKRNGYQKDVLLPELMKRATVTYPSGKITFVQKKGKKE